MEVVLVLPLLVVVLLVVVVLAAVFVATVISRLRFPQKGSNSHL